VVVVGLEIVIAILFIGNVDIASNNPAYGSGKSISIYIFIYIFTQFYQFGIILNAVRVP